MIAAPDSLVSDDSVPQACSLQGAPSNVQLTPLCCSSSWMKALKVWLAPVTKVAFVIGAVATISPASGVIAIVVEEDFVKSAMEMAVRVTSAGSGRLAGAV